MTSSSSSNSRHHRQLDTSLERQARLAAANAVATCFSSPLRRQRSTSLNTSFDQTQWVFIMPTLEVMYLSFAYCIHIYRYIFNSAS
jgi:hypothetical protein